MKYLDVLFTTSRFNLSEVKEHFINPCCFGEDVAAWIRKPLEAKGWATQEPGQEDWGWYVDVRLDDQSYTLSIGGNATEDSVTPNLGEWRIGVQKHLSIKEKFTGKNAFTKDDPLFTQVLEICRSQPDFDDINIETL
jgi:hypothetical protein